MYPIYFKAVLKTQDDRVLEHGYACISMETRSVDFKNEFVPLIKMGTAVKIVQLAGDVETHTFAGEVYLSAPHMLRIVSVSEDELTAAQKQLEVSVSIPARLLPVRSNLEASIPHPKKDWLDAEIYSVSMETVKFSCARAFMTGQKLLVHVDQPFVARKLIVDVYQVLLFGDAVTGHLSSIDALPEPYRRNLAQYVEELNRANRVFPQE